LTQDLYSDADLVAFDDGEMALDAATRLAARLESDSQLESRLTALRIDRKEVAAAFDALLDLAPEYAPLPDKPPVHTPVVHRAAFAPWAMAASLAIAVGLGALGYRAVAPISELAPALGWQELAAAYHALYTTETLQALTSPDAETIAAQLARTGAALGREVPARLTDIPGLSFRRAQVLGHGGVAIIQLSYLDAAGVPYAFCLRATQAGAKDPMQTSEMQVRDFAGVQWVGWRTDGIEYVLLAKRPRAELETLSGVFRARL